MFGQFGLESATLSYSAFARLSKASEALCQSLNSKVRIHTMDFLPWILGAGFFSGESSSTCFTVWSPHTQVLHWGLCQRQSSGPGCIKKRTFGESDGRELNIWVSRVLHLARSDFFAILSNSNGNQFPNHISSQEASCSSGLQEGVELLWPAGEVRKVLATVSQESSYAPWDSCGSLACMR